MLDRISAMVEKLTPGYFALVMASGIISLGLKLVGVEAISTALFAVSGVAYAVLCVLHGWRFVAFRHGAQQCAGTAGCFRREH